MQIEPEESYKRKPVSNMIFHLLIRQVIEGLQHQDFKHERRIKWGTTSFQSLGTTQALFHGLTKVGPGNMCTRGSSGSPF